MKATLFHYRSAEARSHEPYAKDVLDQLPSDYVELLVRQDVAENTTSEQAARMVAMKTASDNAGGLIDDLQLQYNKARQASITQELSEIVGREVPLW